jgi:hypothetical protein
MKSPLRNIWIVLPVVLLLVLAFGICLWRAAETNQRQARQHVEALRQKYPEWFAAVNTFEGRMTSLGNDDENDLKPVLALMPPEVMMIEIERDGGGHAVLSGKCPNHSGYRIGMTREPGYWATSGDLLAGGRRYKTHVLLYDDESPSQHPRRITLFLTP